MKKYLQIFFCLLICFALLLTCACTGKSSTDMDKGKTPSSSEQDVTDSSDGDLLDDGSSEGDGLGGNFSDNSSNKNDKNSSSNKEYDKHNSVGYSSYSKPTANSKVENNKENNTENKVEDKDAAENTDSFKYTDSVKILALGNSFSVDAMEHLYGILKDGGVQNIVLGNLYIGGCSIKTHVSNLDTRAKEYKYYKNTSGKGVTNKNFVANEAIAEEDWDIISIQQASGSSGQADTYEQLESLINHIKAIQPNAKIVWHMTWAYAQNSTHSSFPKYNSNQMTMYNAIVDCAKNKIVPNDNISKVLPSGTAIQNLRTSYLGDTLNRDGYHLSYGIGRYTAALTWYAVITGNNIDDITYIPADYPEVGENLPAIKDAVKKAVANPFEVTESAYKVKK